MPDIQPAIKELQETAIVMSGIQSRQAEFLKDHSEWLPAHDLAMARHDKEMAEARERGRHIDERIDKYLSGNNQSNRRQPLSNVRGSESASEPRTLESGWHAYFRTVPKLVIAIGSCSGGTANRSSCRAR